VPEHLEIVVIQEIALALSSAAFLVLFTSIKRQGAAWTSRFLFDNRLPRSAVSQPVFAAKEKNIVCLERNVEKGYSFCHGHIDRETRRVTEQSATPMEPFIQ